MTTDPRFARLRAETFEALRPPPKLRLSDWCEGHVRLPSSLSATPGPMRLWPQQREILDVIGDDTTERVSILKSARVGATQAMVGALGHFAHNDPAPVIYLMPSEEDSRTFMVSNVEPVFAESPALREALAQEKSRDTLLHRRYPGGSLMVLSARAPRNLRARTARVVFADEIDGYEIDLRGEGDPIELAIKRTLTFSNRKIVLASTPLHEDSSRIVRAYEQSDMRVYEVPCLHCDSFKEILWKDITWPEGKTQDAAWACPECGALVEERQKPQMILKGRWRATAPHVEGHAGFKLTALTSLLPNTAWPKLAAEFLQAKRSPVTLQPFVNTVLGEPWRADGEDLDPAAFARLQRPMSAANLPEDVVALTAGVDCQGDRLEASLVGWTVDGELRVLEHAIIWGAPIDPQTWVDLDAHLSRQFLHPLGGILRLDAAIVDSGNWADRVYEFCRPRTPRRIIAGNGLSGFNRPNLAWGASRKTRLAQIGVDAIKLQLHERIKDGRTVLFSDALGPDYFDQLNAERLVTKYSHGHPTKLWELISGRRNEGLDCLVYATAARQLLPVALSVREPVSRGKVKPQQTFVRSSWLNPA
jgi:phage terminase large subunit GpA-like protein